MLWREGEGRIELRAINYGNTIQAIQQYAGLALFGRWSNPSRAMLAAFDEVVNYYDMPYDTIGIAR